MVSDLWIVLSWGGRQSHHGCSRRNRYFSYIDLGLTFALSLFFSRLTKIPTHRHPEKCGGTGRSIAKDLARREEQILAIEKVITRLYADVYVVRALNSHVFCADAMAKHYDGCQGVIVMVDPGKEWTFSHAKDVLEHIPSHLEVLLIVSIEPCVRPKPPCTGFPVGSGLFSRLLCSRSLSPSNDRLHQLD